MFETKKKLREEIEFLTNSVNYWLDSWRHERIRRIKLEEENEELNKRINILNKCHDADIALIEKLRKENEALKQQLETTYVNVDSFYPSNVWSAVAELTIAKQANGALKEKLVKLQDKIDAIEKIVEE